MSKFEKAALLWDLQSRNQRFKDSVLDLVEMSDSDLNWKPSRSEWSIAQVLEHLNLTHKPYLDQIWAIYAKAESGFEPYYKGGWLGDFIVRKLEERPCGKVKQMYAPRTLRPATILVGPAIITQNIEQINSLEGAITRSRQLQIQSLKVPIPITKILKVHIGDVLRFIIAHSERHLLQIVRVKKQLIATNLLYSLSGNVVPSKTNTRNLSSERP